MIKKKNLSSKSIDKVVRLLTCLGKKYHWMRLNMASNNNNNTYLFHSIYIAYIGSTWLCILVFSFSRKSWHFENLNFPQKPDVMRWERMTWSFLFSSLSRVNFKKSIFPLNPHARIAPDFLSITKPWIK